MPVSCEKALVYVRLFVAEFLGTGLLVFVGCMGCMHTMSTVPHIQASWSFGIAIMYCIQCFVHISGGHINPLVTLTAVILGYMTPLVALLYFFAQMIGGVVGMALLMAITPGKYFWQPEGVQGICTTYPHPDLNIFQALVAEFMVSFVLCVIVCAIWDARNTDKHDSVTIRLGMAVAGLAMAGGPYTGASMNPARSFGPAVINNNWTAHWIYWVGPLGATVVGAGGYRLLFSLPKKKEEE